MRSDLLCPEQDSNLHTSRHAHLKRTRLPIPPSGRVLASILRVTRGKPLDYAYVLCYAFSVCKTAFYIPRFTGPYCLTAKKKSGKRDSNSRPQPWQGCALPTELFPHTFFTPKLRSFRFYLKSAC